MTTKTHLTRQEELVEEVGIQIREDDPTTPETNQIWLNTFDNRLKARVGNLVRVYYENLDTGSLAIPVNGVIDGNKSYNHFKTVTQEETFSFENFFDGVVVRVMLSNEQVNTNRIINVALPASTSMNVGNYWTINSAANIDKYHVWYDFNGTGANEPVVLGSTPLRVIMTAGRKEKTSVRFNATTNTAHSGQHFRVTNSSNIEYHVWYNIGGFGGNPFPANPNGIMVNVTTTTTAEQVASLTASAIGSAGVGFVASSSGDILTIENSSNASVNDFVNAAPNIIVVGASTGVVVQGALPDTSSQIASLTEAVLEATGKFTINTIANEMTITYVDSGSSQPVQNVNIPTGFLTSTTAQGSGPISITLPTEVKFEDGLGGASLVIPPQKTRIYEFVKLATNTVAIYTDFNI